MPGEPCASDADHADDDDKLDLNVEGSVTRWNDAEQTFEAIESSRSLPE